MPRRVRCSGRHTPSIPASRARRTRHQCSGRRRAIGSAPSRIRIAASSIDDRQCLCRSARDDQRASPSPEDRRHPLVHNHSFRPVCHAARHESRQSGVSEVLGPDFDFSAPTPMLARGGRRSHRGPQSRHHVAGFRRRRQTGLATQIVQGSGLAVIGAAGSTAKTSYSG